MEVGNTGWYVLYEYDLYMTHREAICIIYAPYA